MTAMTSERPPSVDTLARQLAKSSALPHPLLVEVARAAIADRSWDKADNDARTLERLLLTPVVNATGVLLHTNLGRAPLDPSAFGAPGFRNLEFDLATGRRGSRYAGIGRLIASACGAEAAMVVNNNAAAVLLVLAALAAGRSVAVSRGESVEIGGSFRVPEVMEQSGARLVDVGTTNRTRADDYRRAINAPGADIALLLKVHPSNYRVDGFTEETTVADLAPLGVPVVADIGSGLLDASCPWLPDGPPAWLAGEPAARQTLADGAALVMFSGDKLLGGPQAGIIAGRADLVAACTKHPLARALRPGGLVLDALHATVLSFLRRDAAQTVPFWSMVNTPFETLTARAHAVVEAVGSEHVRAVAMDAVPGAGSLPGVVLPSFGVVIVRDVSARLRSGRPPVIARVNDGQTWCDLRTVEPVNDATLIAALRDALGDAPVR
jgi:L-seryl-tRNA(Ser) seleniumtransferase